MHISSEELVDRIFQEVKPDSHFGRYRDACFDILKIIRTLTVETEVGYDRISIEQEKIEAEKDGKIN